MKPGLADPKGLTVEASMIVAVPDDESGMIQLRLPHEGSLLSGCADIEVCCYQQHGLCWMYFNQRRNRTLVRPARANETVLP